MEGHLSHDREVIVQSGQAVGGVALAEAVETGTWMNWTPEVAWAVSAEAVETASWMDWTPAVVWAVSAQAVGTAARVELGWAIEPVGAAHWV